MGKRIEVAVLDFYDCLLLAVKIEMVDAGKMYLKDVPVLVDVMVVDNWYEK